ncbi:hypothetical protein T484DRAFT_1748290 [Baffinella frigidus]|nr:hypothetical protein T484DRAFT_1748290 [Cryptophyta sp. CCMP2293]
MPGQHSQQNSRRQHTKIVRCGDERSVCVPERSECVEEGVGCEQDGIECVQEVKECVQEGSECVQGGIRCAQERSGCIQEESECVQERRGRVQEERRGVPGDRSRGHDPQPSRAIRSAPARNAPYEPLYHPCFTKTVTFRRALERRPCKRQGHTDVCVCVCPSWDPCVRLG